MAPLTRCQSKRDNLISCSHAFLGGDIPIEMLARPHTPAVSKWPRAFLSPRRRRATRSSRDLSAPRRGHCQGDGRSARHARRKTIRREPGPRRRRASRPSAEARSRASASATRRGVDPDGCTLICIRPKLTRSESPPTHGRVCRPSHPRATCLGRSAAPPFCPSWRRLRGIQGSDVVLRHFRVCVRSAACTALRISPTRLTPNLVGKGPVVLCSHLPRRAVRVHQTLDVGALSLAAQTAPC